MREKEKREKNQTCNYIMHIKHKTTMYILRIIIEIYIGFLGIMIDNICAPYSKSQIAFKYFSYSEYWQFFLIASILNKQFVSSYAT